MRGREDIGCLLGKGKSSMWKHVYAFKHSQRMMRSVSSQSTVVMVRRSSSLSLSQFSSLDSCTSISTVRPAFDASRRAVSAASDEGDRKVW